MTHSDQFIKDIGQALFIVNRHAKTALDPSNLYRLKNEALTKLLREKKAIKMGLHFSNNPKHTYQHSVLLVQIGDYYFHTPPTKKDIKTLQHLGYLSDSYRNPKATISLSKAKKILFQYLGWAGPSKKTNRQPTYYALSTTKLSPFYHKRKKEY